MAATTTISRHVTKDAGRVTSLNDLNVYARSETIRKLAVVDIGSNSLKFVVYNLSVAPPHIVLEYDNQCGLGEGMKPGDRDPRLNENAVKTVCKEVFPICRQIIDKNEPDGFLVMCTEAVRAAYNNPLQKDNVNVFLKEAADILGIPVEAINILSEKMEAELAAENALCADLDDVHGIMMGGASAEFFQIRDGKIHQDRCVTMRFGTRSLAGSPRQNSRIIRDGFKSIPWFGNDARADPRYGKQTTHLTLSGGAFRFIGRLLAERIDKINFDANMPFGGYTFANDAVLDGHLRNLLTSTRSSLFEYTFRHSNPDNLLRTKIGNDVYVRLHDLLIEKNSFEKMCAKWEKRIGRRAASISVGIQTILEAIRRLQPRTVNFSPHNMRDAALRRAGLAYV